MVSLYFELILRVSDATNIRLILINHILIDHFNDCLSRTILCLVNLQELEIFYDRTIVRILVVALLDVRYTEFVHRELALLIISRIKFLQFRIIDESTVVNV